MSKLAKILQQVPERSLVAELHRRRLAAESQGAHAVLAAVADAWGTPAAEILAQRVRSRAVTDPRQAAMYILRERGHTTSSIGRMFGMDHGTAIYAHKTHPRRMRDPYYAEKFREAMATLLTHPVA